MGQYIDVEVDTAIGRADAVVKLQDTICKYFVICQGNSPSQVSAIVDSIKEFTRKGADSKPYACLLYTSRCV